jgi:hypothetical protein
MNMRLVITLSVVAAVIAPAAVARADGPLRTPPWAIRFEPGLVLTTDHMHPTGVGGPPPPLYFGASLERAIAGPVRLNASGGASLILGWMIGGTVRYVAVEQANGTFTIGAGPLFAPDADFGSATFAQIDATVQLGVAGSFGIVLAGSLGVALNRQRAPKCGVDTCESYLARGDRIGSVRMGIGWAF